MDTSVEPNVICSLFERRLRPLGQWFLEMTHLDVEGRTLAGEAVLTYSYHRTLRLTLNTVYVDKDSSI